MKTKIVIILICCCFTINANAQNEKIVLPCVNISNIDQIGEYLVLFEWEPVKVSGLVGYNIQISDSPTFSNLLTNVVTSDLSYEWNAPKQIGTYSYFVRIRIAVVLESPGPFCLTTKFVVAP